ncbi:MAG: 16S rRNA (cytidine(1402)-2'-O)-methyltransferase [Actinobacteria bacterium]|nr:16S rRNA (cytidine(1402)-2'-O)-methyltransferase [Actinomycetota bacterium]MCL6104590.1 16S rRNA (cytidine(1402)-2'-O)-methyltransferase [Actinomycetota bacterium]
MTGGGNGVLVLVATPIGNLGDLSPRSIQALENADVIACEDTRHTRKLLSHAGIHAKRLISLHEHNETSQLNTILGLINRGSQVALVSDAGMPLISDPGERLVAKVISSGFTVSVVPGPSAVLGALVISGFGVGRFCFEGFLPRKGSARKKRLEVVAGEERTVLIFESPYRLTVTLMDLLDYCGRGRRVAVVKELTKLHEEIWRGSLEEVVHELSSKTIKGEYVIVLEGLDQ